MTTEQKLLKKLVAAGDALPETKSYEDFMKDTPEKKHWADVFQEVKDYAATLIDVDRKFENLTEKYEKEKAEKK